MTINNSIFNNYSSQEVSLEEVAMVENWLSLDHLCEDGSSSGSPPGSPCENDSLKQKEMLSFVCSSLGSIDENTVTLPEIGLSSILKPEDSQTGFDFASSFLKNLYKARGKKPLSKAQLDAVVKALKANEKLFIWKNDQEGCFTRALLIGRILKILGSPKENIRCLFLKIPTSFWNPLRPWNFHVAIQVFTKEGNCFVLDPLLGNESLSEDKWKKEVLSIQPSDWINLGPRSEATARTVDQLIYTNPVQFHTPLFNLGPFDPFIFNQRQQDVFLDIEEIQNMMEY